MICLEPVMRAFYRNPANDIFCPAVVSSSSAIRLDRATRTEQHFSQDAVRRTVFNGDIEAQHLTSPRPPADYGKSR